MKLSLQLNLIALATICTAQIEMLRLRDVIGHEKEIVLNQAIDFHGGNTYVARVYEGNRMVFTVMNTKDQPLQELTFEMNSNGALYQQQQQEKMIEVMKRRGAKLNPNDPTKFLECGTHDKENEEENDE